MASFSIHDLLGLGKAAESGLKTDGTAKTKKQDGAAAEDERNRSINVETLEEEEEYNHEAHHQLVTVEVTTMRHESSLSRSSSSRKRKRTTDQAAERENTPVSDDEYPERKSTISPSYSSAAKDQDSRSSKRLRTAFTTAQLRTLEYFFRMCPYPDSYGREQIARATGIDEAKIQVWFQNRRARYRKREKPMESQKSPAGRSPTPSTPSLSPHSMMQAFFTAAALSGSKLPTTAAPSPQQFFSPGLSPFFTTGFTAMPPYPPYFTYPPSAMANTALAAQAHSPNQPRLNPAQQTAKNS